MTVTHDFHTDLATSERIATEPWWEEVYRNEFPYFESMEQVLGNTPQQRAGIDRIIHLKGGATVLIEEKVRHEDYDDVLLEIHSSLESKTPGWACKPLHCDYIAYAFLPSRRCYFFPFRQLQRALKIHWNDWMSYPSINSRNRNYTTRSIAIPIPELQRAITEASCVRWGAEHPSSPRIRF